MAEMSYKEKAVSGVAFTVLLALLLVAMWFMHFSKSWKSAKAGYDREIEEDRREKLLISQKETLEENYRKEVLKIPEIANADTRCQEVIVDLAHKHGITVKDNNPQPIDDFDSMKRMNVKISWTGTFEALVSFLYELETSDVGKFDVSELTFSANEKKNPGQLSGSMTLTSIYRMPDGQ
ncbi:MAG: type II secretion system protein M [Kiritimatiellae bacterium]|nr:type II secretion system protein M [Kiritimatiellia bacterium]